MQSTRQEVSGNGYYTQYGQKGLKMGLTIHYEYELKQTHFQIAQNHINHLFKHCVGMQEQGLLQTVTIRYFSEKEMAECYADPNSYNMDAINADPNLWRWPLIQAPRNVIENNRWTYAYPRDGWIIRSWPGEGCELSNFGLMRFNYPDEERSQKWGWSSFCKTQYASRVSIQHFIQCHLSVLSVLDYLKTDDVFEVEVNDESDYWDQRDKTLLTDNLEAWNDVIGRVGSLLGVAK